MIANHSVGLTLGIIGAVLAFLLLGLPGIIRWRRLARSYPGRGFVAKHTYKALSGMVAGGVFRRVLQFSVGNDGVRFSIPALFGWLLPPFVVPWDAVVTCRRERVGFSDEGLRIEIAGESEPIYLRGFLWRDGDAVAAILERWQAR
jgi:hypothetical protein